MEIIKEAKLKCYIVSAGIKSVVSETMYILQYQRTIDLSNNLYFCMTSEVFDSSNTLIAFEKPAIISTNKHLFVSHEKYSEIKKGSNAIVMGDLIDDQLITQNLTLGVILRIGFFNFPVDKESIPLLQSYLDTFDIVIVGDGNISHVAELVNWVTFGHISEEYAKMNPAGKGFAEFLRSITI